MNKLTVNINGQEIEYNIPSTYSEFTYSGWVSFFKTQGDFLIKLLAAGGFDLNLYLATRNKFGLKPSDIDYIQLNSFKNSFVDEQGKLLDIEIVENPLPMFDNILVNFYGISLYSEKLYATNIMAISFEQFVVCEQHTYMISEFEKENNEQGIENSLREIFKTIYLPENQTFKYGEVRKINVDYPNLMICYYHYITMIAQILSIYKSTLSSENNQTTNTQPSVFWWEFKINYFNLTGLQPDIIDKMNLEDILKHIEILKNGSTS